MTDQELAAQPETSPRLDVASLVRETRAHARWFFGVFGLVFSGFLLWWIIQPVRYASTASMEYAPFGASDTSAQASDGASQFLLHELIATENYVLKSRALAERVVVKLRLHEGQGSSKAKVKPRSIEAVAEELRARVQVRNVPGTRVVTLTVTADTAARAQQLANTYLETYIEKSIEDRVSTSARAVEWLSEQMKVLEGELESAETNVTAFRERTGALAASTAERRAMITEQIKELTSTLGEIQTRRVYTQAKLDVLRKALDATTDHVSLNVSPLAEDSTLRALRERFRMLTVELEPLVLAHGEEHPDVRSRRAALKALTEQIEQQIRSIVAGIEAELKELDAAEKSFKNALNQANIEGAELARYELEFTRLDRARSAKSQMIQLMMERASQANLSRALHVASARIVDRASLPTAPASPRTLETLLLGLFSALVLGVLSAFFAARITRSATRTRPTS